MAIRFERLISRSVAVALSHELDMAGVKTSVEGSSEDDRGRQPWRCWS